MSPIIANINDYIKYKKYKKTYIIFKTGFSKSKVYKILKSDNPKYKDIEAISIAIGKNLAFFLPDNYEKNMVKIRESDKMLKKYGTTNIHIFYNDVCCENEKNIKIVNNIINMVNCIDAILGTKKLL